MVAVSMSLFYRGKSFLAQTKISLAVLLAVNVKPLEVHSGAIVAQPTLIVIIESQTCKGSAQMLE